MAFIYMLVWLVGVWLLTASAPFKKPRMRCAARSFARLAATLTVLIFITISVFGSAFAKECGPAFMTMLSISYASVWLIADFAMMRYCKRLCGTLGHASLARQFGALSWIYMIVINLTLLGIIIGSNCYGINIERYPPARIIIACLSLVVRTWLICVMLGYFFSNRTEFRPDDS